jgi:hypothetical protein
MNSVQSMRWVLVSMTAVTGIIAAAIGQIVPAVVLLFGVAIHCAHWYSERRSKAAGPDGSPSR